MDEVEVVVVVYQGEQLIDPSKPNISPANRKTKGGNFRKCNPQSRVIYRKYRIKYACKVTSSSSSFSTTEEVEVEDFDRGL